MQSCSSLSILWHCLSLELELPTVEERNALNQAKKFFTKVNRTDQNFIYSLRVILNECKGELHIGPL